MIFCVVFLIIGFIASTQQVDVTMKTSRKAFAEQYGIITLEITNNDSENFRFLTYQTVFEDFIGADMFEVKTMTGGEEMSYMGPLARRISPAPPSAYLEVAVGTSLSVDFNITEYYSITRSGFFSITSKMEVFSPYKLTSLNLFLFPNKEVFSFEENKENNKQVANKYTNCNTEEKGQVDSSTNTAITQASKAYDCMAANSCSQLADTWFGAYTTSNYNYDLNCFYNIETTLKNNGINAYCNPAGCGANVYAYVYPADPAQTVYLCGAFWSQPLERPNTIVHEMSHFNVIAGTDDYTYGRASCKTLANNNPYQASRNADNVCYFSEDSLGF